jgi:aspartyl-tRNA(Asn)/glutamyl-tRNA(Gln) amidotransferase subunit C
MSEEIGRADVERLARLARLRLSDEELTRFAGQLARILAYANAVREVNTADIPPTSHPFADEAEHVRDDRVAPSLDRDQAVAAAPDADRRAGLFKVPRVL